MYDLIAGLIHTSKGYFYETAGMIIGFFNDAAQARRCADEIMAIAGKTAEVFGSQLFVSL